MFNAMTRCSVLTTNNACLRAEATKKKADEDEKVQPLQAVIE